MNGANYERFEFLGDSILSFIIAHELFKRFPDESEGQLSRLRSYLVKGDTLGDIAKEINLGECLYLGQGELKSGGFRRISILADSLEALFAAIFFDSGIEAVKAVILNLYHSRLNSPELYDCLKDAKTRLQEYLQAHRITLPEYQLSRVEGDEHDQVFYISCMVNNKNRDVTYGQGGSRRKAEQQAAKNMLDLLLIKKK